MPKKKIDPVMEYAAQIDDSMADLHNRLAAFIAEVKIPLPMIMLVLKMLEKEVVDQAYKQYLGE
jgi:hypothetical protein